MCIALQQGPDMITNYIGGNINWLDIQNKRLQNIEDCKNGHLPECCKGCINLETKEWDNNTKLKYFEICHWSHCNCGCFYCANIDETKGNFSGKVRKSEYYDFLPILKDIIKNDALSNDAHISFVGGEPAVLKEFDNIFKLFIKKNPQEMSVLTSGIRFMKTVAKAIKTNKMFLIISIDAGTRETYKKIKRTDSFDIVLKNTKKYVKEAKDAANSVILKYIILENINDNTEEIEKWLLAAASIGITSVDLSMEFCHSTHKKKGENIPSHYYKLFEFAENKSKELGLRLSKIDIVEKILNQGHY